MRPPITHLAEDCTERRNGMFLIRYGGRGGAAKFAICDSAIPEGGRFTIVERPFRHGYDSAVPA